MKLKLKNFGYFQEANIE